MSNIRVKQKDRQTLSVLQEWGYSKIYYPLDNMLIFVINSVSLFNPFKQMVFFRKAVIANRFKNIAFSFYFKFCQCFSGFSVATSVLLQVRQPLKP